MEITDTLFEGDVWENISDVNRATQIIHARKRINLNEFKRNSVSGDFF